MKYTKLILVIRCQSVYGLVGNIQVRLPSTFFSTRRRGVLIILLLLLQLSRLMGGDVRLVDAGFGIEHKPSLANAVEDVKSKGGKVARRASSLFVVS